jgi:xanthine dehydrogenase YagS FAD-binding subunit
MNFEYLKPMSLDEAFKMLEEHENAKLYAGGTDLLWQMRAETVAPDYIIDLKGVQGLDKIKETEEAVEIGAMTTLRAVETSALLLEKYPAVSEAAKVVASQKLRNKATIGGNLLQRIKCPFYNQSHINLFQRESIDSCFKRGGKKCLVMEYGDDVYHTITGKSYCKAPIPSDLAIPLAALDASVILKSFDGEREIPLTELYKVGGELSLKAGEILVKICIPKKGNQRNGFAAHMAFPGSFSQISVAADLIMEGNRCVSASIYLGGVSQKPYAAQEVETLLIGAEIYPEIINGVVLELFKDVKITNDDVLFKIAKARDMLKDLLHRLV